MGYLAPGSPIDNLLGQHSSAEARKRLEHEYGLDRPALVQYGSFLGKAVRGDLGRSISYDRPITQMIAEKFPVTAQLACMAMAFAILVGLPAGIIAALKPNRFIYPPAMGFLVLSLSLPRLFSAPTPLL